MLVERVYYYCLTCYKQHINVEFKNLDYRCCQEMDLGAILPHQNDAVGVIDVVKTKRIKYLRKLKLKRMLK